KANTPNTNANARVNYFIGSTVNKFHKKSFPKINCGCITFVYNTPKKLMLIKITAIAGIYVPKYFSIKPAHTATINVTSPFTEKGTINKNKPNNNGIKNFKYITIECYLFSSTDVTPIIKNVYIYIKANKIP